MGEVFADQRIDKTTAANGPRLRETRFSVH